MSGYVCFDPGCMLVLEDADHAGRFLLATGADGTRVRVPLTAEMCRMMGYHGALAYREMTGKTCLMCPGVTMELPPFEPPPDPLGKLQAPRSRTRTRIAAPPPAPVSPIPRVRTRRGPLP